MPKIRSIIMDVQGILYRLHNAAVVRENRRVLYFLIKWVLTPKSTSVAAKIEC